MKIGEAGEAFFVFETDADVPDDLITSPLLEPTQPNLPDSLPSGDISDDAVGQEPDFLDLDAPSSGPHSSPGTPSQRTGNLPSSANARKASAPLSIGGKEIPTGSVVSVTRGIAHPVAASNDGSSTDRDIEKVDAEEHPCVKDLPTPYITKGGRVSCFSYWKCSSDIRTKTSKLTWRGIMATTSGTLVS